MTTAGDAIRRGLLVLLVGAPGSGKSTWALRHFPREQVVSSDELRAAVCGDPNDQAATPYAVRLLHTFVAARLHFGQTTVVDATNGEPEHRATLLRLAELSRTPAVAVVFDVPLVECLRRNAQRLSGRRVPETFLRTTHRRIRDGLPVTGAEPPTGYVAAVVVGPDGSRLLGQLPDPYLGASWAAAAR